MKVLIRNQKGICLVEVGLMLGIAAVMLVMVAMLGSNMPAPAQETVELRSASSYDPNRQFSKEEADDLIAQYGAKPGEEWQTYSVSRPDVASADALQSPAGPISTGASSAETAPVAAAIPAGPSYGAPSKLALGGSVSGDLRLGDTQIFPIDIPADQEVRFSLTAEGSGLSGTDADLKVINKDGWTEARLMQIGDENGTVRLKPGRYDLEVSLALGNQASFVLRAEPAS